jgi:hypothetical protein
MKKFEYDFEAKTEALNRVRSRLDDIEELLNFSPKLQKEYASLLLKHQVYPLEMLCARARIAIEDLINAPHGTIPESAAVFLEFGQEEESVDNALYGSKAASGPAE